MKIKSDFVTNSSSTAYVVCIPSDFKAKKDDVIKYMKTYDDYDYLVGGEEINEDKVLDNINTALDELKGGDEVWQQDLDDEYIDFHILLEICENNNFLIKAFEYHSDGCNQMHGIKQKIIEDWIVATKLKSLERLGEPDE